MLTLTDSADQLDIYCQDRPKPIIKRLGIARCLLKSS